MAKYTLDIDVNYKSVEDLQGELRALEAEFSTLSIGSEGFVELGNKIKGIKSQLKDVELQFEGLDKEQRAAALVDTFNGLTGAVGAVSSAFIAFGAESQAIEDAEKKLLGVIGVVSGLRDVSNALVSANKLLGPSFDALGTTIKAAMTSGTVATQTLKAALASLGIPLLIAGVVALVDYMSSFNEETEKVATTGVEGFEAFNKEIEKGNSLLQARLGYIKAQFGEEQALNEQLKSIQAEREKRRQKEVDLFDELNRAETASDKKKIKDLIDENLKKNIELEGQELSLQKSIQKIKDDAAKEEQKKAEEAAKALADTRKERAKNEKDALLAEAESKRQLAIQLEDDEKARRKLILEDEIADLKVARDAALEQENLTAEAKRAIRAKFNNDVKAAEDKFTNDIADIDKKAEDKRIADAEKAAADLKAFNERAYSSELSAINTFYTARENEVKSKLEQGLITQQEYDAQLQQIELTRLNNLLQATKDAGQSTVEVEKQILDAKIALKNKDAETTKTTEEAKRAAQMATLDATSQILGAAAGLAQEGSAAAKAFGLAQIGVDTAIALTNAQASAFSPASPDNAVTGGAAGVAKYLTYAAIILSNVAKAKAILSSGGKGGTGSATTSIPTGGGTASPAPIPTTQGTFKPTLPQGTTTPGSQGGFTPVFKTYVVSGDVTDAQQAEAQINQKRKF